MSVTVSSYPPPRQEISSSSVSSESQPMPSPQLALPLHSPISTIPQGLSQIPEEYSNRNHNDQQI